MVAFHLEQAAFGIFSPAKASAVIHSLTEKAFSDRIDTRNLPSTRRVSGIAARD